MPIHDWTKAPSGYFHHFHQRWTGAICDALNAGLLPKGMFALVEQHTAVMVPDVLALEARPPHKRGWSERTGGTALATELPQTRFISRGLEEEVYATKANRVVVYGDDETIAVIEIVSPGNKSSGHALRQFVDESLDLLERGIHLLVIDLLPPTPWGSARDSCGHLARNQSRAVYASVRQTADPRLARGRSDEGGLCGTCRGRRCAAANAGLPRCRSQYPFAA